jgi:hypothetical protein
MIKHLNFLYGDKAKIRIRETEKRLTGAFRKCFISITVVSE